LSLSKLSSIVEHWVAGLNCLVLVWSWNSFKRDFTIKFKEIEDTIGDWLSCQIHLTC